MCGQVIVTAAKFRIDSAVREKADDAVSEIVGSVIERRKQAADENRAIIIYPEHADFAAVGGLGGTEASDRSSRQPFKRRISLI